jgi:hypothetical protein
MLPHNERTWGDIRALLVRQGSADYRELVTTARDHAKTSPQEFVVYCISSGWLARGGR